MAVASSSNNLVATFSAPPVKPGAYAADGDHALFSHSLNQQIQSRKPEQTKPEQTKRSCEGSQPSTQTEGVKDPEQAAATDAADTKDADQTASLDENESATGDDDAIAAEQAQMQVAVAGTAVLLAQLQEYVDRGLDTEQAKAEAGDDASVKCAGLAKALLDDKQDKAASATDLTAKLAVDRQALPTEAGKEDLPTINNQFSQLLERNTQVGEAGARQVSQSMVRVDTSRSQPGDHSKAMYAVNQPIGSTGWDRAVGHKVVMMVSNQQQEVEMQLNPPHLGPMEVKLTLNQDQASLTFVVAQTPVRDALQNSMPRLQEMLAENGIQLGQVNVQTRSDQGNTPSDQQATQFSRGNAQPQVKEAVSPPVWRSRVVTGLPGNVNLFV
ncbi:flagellar hook-length control protein FliK [Chitinimonas sp. BJB300]|uniref:flagellar hook-length control protein FliK n=1 Tax=Chitinimonas sp. BJB300 TaxID=1559339 RepID=UPI0013046F31|nr:flagellar hook-length control protein FliK [Chitinimonas sp. BJB300]